MNVIDDEILVRELRTAADEFAVSPASLDRVMAAALAPDADPAGHRIASALRDHPRRQRWLVAASVVALGTAIAVPLMRAESPGVPAVRSAAGIPKVINGTGFTADGTHGTPSSEQGILSLGIATSSATDKSLQNSRVTTSTKIESSGRISVTVARGGVDAAVRRLTSLAGQDGGSVVNSYLQSSTRASGGFVGGTIVLEVPQPRFAALVSQVQGVGHATSMSTSSVDVTGQYVDLTARITSLEASRRQYLAIMTRASSIGDILAVQAQLNSLQSQIEQLQGQRNLLDHQTSFGTLTVNLSERGHHASAPTKGNGIARAFSGAVHGFVRGVEWLIRASGPALFALLCLGALGLLGRRLWRAARRRTL